MTGMRRQPGAFGVRGMTAAAAPPSEIVGAR